MLVVGNSLSLLTTLNFLQELNNVPQFASSSTVCGYNLQFTCIMHSQYIYTHTHELEYNPPSVRKLCSHKLTVCPQVCFHNLLLEMNPRSPVRRVGKRCVSRSPRLSCLFMQAWCLWSHFGLGPNQGSSQGTQNLPPQRVPCHWAH